MSMTVVLDALEEKRNGWPRRTDPSVSRPAPPGPSQPPRRAPPCPDLPMVCLGFGPNNMHFAVMHPIIFGTDTPQCFIGQQ